MKQMLSEEQILESIKSLLERNPNANRKEIFKIARVGYDRFNDLVAQGKIKLPPKMKQGAHWRGFKI